jgi:putative zinc finger/helix-turn-helix YgiT family protein
MKCGRCHGNLVPVEKERTVEFRGRSAIVPARYFECDGCGELLVDPSDSTNASQRAADEVRRREGLLVSEEIRAIRNDLRLTQREFERLLRVGKNTVVRWEAGSVIQSPAIDDKIRALRYVPGLVDFLATRNDVKVSNSSAAASVPASLASQNVQIDHVNVFHDGSTASAEFTTGAASFAYLGKLRDGSNLATA